MLMLNWNFLFLHYCSFLTSIEPFFSNNNHGSPAFFPKYRSKCARGSTSTGTFFFPVTTSSPHFANRMPSTSTYVFHTTQDVNNNPNQTKKNIAVTNRDVHDSHNNSTC